MLSMHQGRKLFLCFVTFNVSRPHRMQAVLDAGYCNRCRTWPVCLCVFGTTASRAKTAEPIEILFARGKLARWPTEPCIISQYETRRSAGKRSSTKMINFESTLTQLINQSIDRANGYHLANTIERSVPGAAMRAIATVTV